MQVLCYLAARRRGTSQSCLFNLLPLAHPPPPPPHPLFPEIHSSFRRLSFHPPPTPTPPPCCHCRPSASLPLPLLILSPHWELCLIWLDVRKHFSCCQGTHQESPQIPVWFHAILALCIHSDDMESFVSHSYKYTSLHRLKIMLIHNSLGEFYCFCFSFCAYKFTFEHHGCNELISTHHSPQNDNAKHTLSLENVFYTVLFARLIVVSTHTQVLNESGQHPPSTCTKSPFLYC